MLKLIRAKQWIKNFFVFFAIVFSGNLLNTNDILRVFTAFLSFCAISSCVYIINDMIDVDKDRQHPKKKNRPLASGAISVNVAKVIFVCLFAFSIAVAASLGIKILLIVGTYFIMNLLYCLKLKNVVILDVLIIAFGFVLRMTAGGVAINVDISPWILLCTLFLALFLGLNKRKGELILVGNQGGETRKILREYSVELINEMLSVVTASTIISYSLYTIIGANSKYMMITIPFIIYGVFRYQYLIFSKTDEDSPESLILGDAPLLVSIGLWGVICVAIIYAKV